MTQGKKIFYNEVTMMKAMATLFITWFHFKWSVPETLAPLFIGGAIGNSLFFFCSGYLLKFKEERYPGQWLVGKYLRVMPAVWITMFVISVFDGCMRGILDVPKWNTWLWPQHYWFICSILVYFVLVYAVRGLLVGERKALWLKVMMGGVAVVQVVWYVMICDTMTVNIDEGYLKAWYFLIFFLWGYYAKNCGQEANRSRWSLVWGVLSLALFFGYKKLADQSLLLTQMQVVFVPLLLAFVIYAYRGVANWLLRWNMPQGVKNGIIFLSNITLEIYIVQMYIINWVMPIVPFPVNMMVSLIVVLTVAYGVHVAAGWLTNKLKLIV